MGSSKWQIPAACAAALILSSGAALAQKYPERPVRLVVPYPSGASGNIGAELVARSPADGHTLLFGTGGLLSIGPHLYKNLGYDPHNDLAPVTLFAVVPYVLVINASVPAKNIQEFVAYAKSRPGKLSFASSGIGGTPHLCVEMLKMMTGIDMLHVPYKGGAPAVVDTIGGQTQAYCAGLAATMPHVRSGKLRALGVTTLKRSAGAPDLPTLDEQGLKGFDVNSWGAIFVPAKTPKAVIQALHEAIAAVMNTDAMNATLIKQGMDPVLLDPKQLADLVKAESMNWARVIKAAGIKLE
jgi:tripartite-type tricarboxylate transporter receptor subunit TctC